LPVCQEAEIEPEVVPDEDRAAQQLHQLADDLVKAWRHDDVGGGDAMDVRRPDVAAWIDQRRVVADALAVGS
jgi:hypothetical protein